MRAWVEAYVYMMKEMLNQVSHCIYRPEGHLLVCVMRLSPQSPSPLPQRLGLRALGKGDGRRSVLSYMSKYARLGRRVVFNDEIAAQQRIHIRRSFGSGKSSSTMAISVKRRFEHSRVDVEAG